MEAHPEGPGVAHRGLDTCNLMYPFLSSQATQILLALIIVGLGTMFVLNYIRFSQRFPLVVLTGYPFWGALIVSTLEALEKLL